MDGIFRSQYRNQSKSFSHVETHSWTPLHCPHRARDNDELEKKTKEAISERIDEFKLTRSRKIGTFQRLENSQIIVKCM